MSTKKYTPIAPHLWPLSSSRPHQALKYHFGTLPTKYHPLVGLISPWVYTPQSMFSILNFFISFFSPYFVSKLGQLYPSLRREVGAFRNSVAKSNGFGLNEGYQRGDDLNDRAQMNVQTDDGTSNGGAFHNINESMTNQCENTIEKGCYTDVRIELKSVQTTVNHLPFEVLTSKSTFGPITLLIRQDATDKSDMIDKESLHEGNVKKKIKKKTSNQVWSIFNFLSIIGLIFQVQIQKEHFIQKMVIIGDKLWKHNPLREKGFAKISNNLNEPSHELEQFGCNDCEEEYFNTDLFF